MVHRQLMSSGPAEVTARRVGVNGVELHVLTSGDPRAEPLLCMPGALGTAETDFRPQL